MDISSILDDEKLISHGRRAREVSRGDTTKTITQIWSDDVNSNCRQMRTGGIVFQLKESIVFLLFLNVINCDLPGDERVRCVGVE